MGSPEGTPLFLEDMGGRVDSGGRTMLFAGMVRAFYGDG